MSELQDLCAALTAIDQDILTMAQTLEQHAQRSSRAAQYAAATARAEDGTARPGASQVVTALTSAGRNATQAAQLLAETAHQGRAFVARAVGGASAGVSSPSPESGSSAEAGQRVRSVEEIKEWIGEINPGSSSDPFSPRSVNCGSCALAVFARLNGVSNAVAGIGSLSVSEMESRTGRNQTSMSPREIREYLVQQGSGSHAIVGIDRQFGPGHWFNAYFDGNRVVGLDGQTGEIHDWPPDYGSNSNPVVNWDVGV